MQQGFGISSSSTRNGPVSAGEVVELAAAGEDDDGDVDVAQHGELLGLLYQSVPALGEGHLPAALVFDSLYLHLPPPHWIVAALRKSPSSQASDDSSVQLKRIIIAAIKRDS